MVIRGISSLSVLALLSLSFGLAPAPTAYSQEQESAAARARNRWRELDRFDRPVISELELPIPACRGRKLIVMQGQETVRVLEDKLTGAQKTLVGGRSDKYASIECDPANRIVPGADFWTGAFFSDFYQHVSEYEGARRLAIQAGRKRIEAYQAESARLEKMGQCLGGGAKTWTDLDALKTGPACSEAIRFLQQEYRTKLKLFRYALAMSADNSGASFTRGSMLNHLNGPMRLPFLWPGANTPHLSEIERKSLTKMLTAFYDEKAAEFKKNWESKPRPPGLTSLAAEDLPGFQSFMKKAWEKEMSEQREVMHQLLAGYPSLVQVRSPDLSPADAVQLLSDIRGNLSGLVADARKSVETLETSASTEKMDEVFSLIAGGPFLEQALQEDPTLCAPAAGVLARLSNSVKRSQALGLGIGVAALVGMRFVPTSLMRPATLAFLGLDGYFAYDMMEQHKKLERDFGASLKKDDHLVIDLESVIRANRTAALGTALLVGTNASTLPQLNRMLRGLPPN